MVSAQDPRTAWSAAPRRARRIGLCALVVALASLGLAGCGSSNSGSAAPATSSTSSGGSAVTAVAADVANLLNPNSTLFNYSRYLPTTPVKPKAGARIAIIAAALASPVVAQYSKAVANAAGVAGYVPQEFDGKFQPSVESVLISQVVQQKYAGIVLVGVTPNTVLSSLEAAKAAGIPVVSFDGYGDSYSTNGVTDIGIDPVAAGKAVAKWIIADSGGKAKVLAVTFPAGQSGGSQSITEVGQEALIATLKTCSGCSVSNQDIALADVVAPGSPVYVNTLRQYAKGSIGYVASGCDSCMVFFSQIDTQLGRTELKVTGGIAVGATGLAEIAGKQNNAMVAPVQPDQLIGLLTIDALARRLDGQTVANMTSLPEPLVTAANASSFPGSAFTPSENYVATFRNLWK